MNTTGITESQLSLLERPQDLEVSMTSPVVVPEAVLGIEKPMQTIVPRTEEEINFDTTHDQGNGLMARVAAGMGLDSDKKSLLEYYEGLPEAQPNYDDERRVGAPVVRSAVQTSSYRRSQRNPRRPLHWRERRRA